MLSYHPNAKVIGTQTAGADGGITALFLPKGLTTLAAPGIYFLKVTDERSILIRKILVD